MLVGEWHVTFKLDWAPEARVDVCLDRGRMVGLVVTGNLSARALQRIPLRSLERAALSKVRTFGDKMLRTADGNGAPLSSFLGEAQYHHLLELGIGSPAGTPERLLRLASFAAHYVQLCGVSPTPTKDLAIEDGVAPATVRDRLHQARREGLLTSAGSGRAGGELTPKAEALLSAGKEA